MFETKRHLVRCGLTLLALACWHAGPGARAARADVAKAQETSTPAAPATRDPRIAEIDAQIKALREQFHAQLDPLEAQVKALRNKFEPQISALEDQRRELVESGKPAEIRALDEQEAAEMKSLADQEKTEIEKVRQHFADERKEVQAKYQQRRKELHGAK